MVVAAAVVQLLVIGIDILPNKLGLAEIHRSTFDREYLAGGHESGIDGSEGRSVHIKGVVADRMLRRITGEVEIGVVGHIYEGRSIRDSLVADVEGIGIRDREGDVRFHVPREMLVAVRRDALELDSVRTLLHDIIELVLPTPPASVQAMPEVIAGELVLLAVDGEPAVLDAVGIAAYGCSEIGLVAARIVVLQVIETQDHVAQHAVPVRNHERDYASAIVGNADFHPGTISDGVEFRGLTIASHRGGQDGHEGDNALFHIT